MPGELARDAGLSAEEEIGRVMKNEFDRLQHEMSTRTFFTTKRPAIHLDFCWTLRLFYLTLSDEDAIRRNCADFANIYDTDIHGYELFIENCDCRMLPRNRTEALPETP